MDHFQTVIRCYDCGKPVSGVDAALGLVVRALVTCPECIAEICINCRRHFVEPDVMAMFMYQDTTVGPLCVACATIIAEAKAVMAAYQSGGPHAQ